MTILPEMLLYDLDVLHKKTDIADITDIEKVAPR